MSNINYIYARCFRLSRSPVFILIVCPSLRSSGNHRVYVEGTRASILIAWHKLKRDSQLQPVASRISSMKIKREDITDVNIID